MFNTYSFHQLIAVTPVNLIEFMMGYGCGWFPPVFSWLSLRFTVQQTSLIASLYYVGRGIGPFVLTYLIDRVGRNRLFVGAAALCVLQYVSLLASQPQTAYVQYATRLAMGVAAGIHEPATSIYIGENCSPSARGIFNGVVILHFVTGMLTALVLGTYCSYTALNLFGLVAASTALLSAFFVLRQPAHFLLMKDHVDQAERNFAWLRGTTDETKREFEEIRAYIEKERAAQRQSVWMSLACPEARRSVIIVVLLTSLFMLTGFPPICQYITIALADSKFVLTPCELSIIYGLINFVMLCVGSFVMDAFNRRTLSIFSSLVIALSSISAAVLFIVSRTHNSYALTVAKFVTLGLSSGTYGAISFPLTAALRGELLPQQVKAIGSSLAIIVGSLAGFLSSQVFLPVMVRFGIEFNFYMYAFFALCILPYTHWWVPETRGKTLVQIQHELRMR